MDFPAFPVEIQTSLASLAWRPDVVSFNTALAAVSSSNLDVKSLRYLVLGLKRGLKDIKIIFL